MPPPPTDRSPPMAMPPPPTDRSPPSSVHSTIQPDTQSPHEAPTGSSSGAHPFTRPCGKDPADGTTWIYPDKDSCVFLFAFGFVLGSFRCFFLELETLHSEKFNLKQLDKYNP
ncbi:uncharacterized protein G2W53_039839 [Senna tora]|uniref:Uncharacterized protein n=1 Tax=Senna tora TaxID=362788 RepID=A0A834W3X1_9FABA|nr:uncharacterized protein G2W53_039839 [Senna tora]